MQKMKRMSDMRRAAALLCVLVLLCATGAQAVTLQTTSTFVGTDLGAQAYVDILAEWEARTGNTVEDQSESSDETWKARVLNDFAAGNDPDILFFFACTTDSRPLLGRVVPVREINAAYPGLNLPESDLLREADGEVYAVSVRPFWEALLVNVDLFEAYGLALPTDAEKLERAIAVFTENNIIPIAASLSDVPHYLAEVGILSSGSVADHRARPQTVAEIPASWIRGMELVRHLYAIGAFAKDVNATSVDLAVAAFTSKEAAMLIDGSWQANGIDEENWETTIVMPFPTYHEDAAPTAILGGTSMGFYLSRKAWEDGSRRDAAVSLLQALTDENASARLGFAFGGRLLQTAGAMFDAAMEEGTMCNPIQDRMEPEARAYWLGMIPSIADGSANPADVMRRVIEIGAFAEGDE